jgi:hypothetical protein
MLQRSAQMQVEPIATRSSAYAPELVTPPAPRPDVPTTATTTEPALDVAERVAEQRARIAELQRVAEREHQARVAAAAPQSRVDASTTARIAEIQQRATEQASRREEARQADARRDAVASTERAAAAQAERARLEERIAHRVAERTRQHESQRLHETAREAAARDARIAAAQTEAPAAAPVADAPRVSAALAAAVASLPPELAAMVAGTISQRPERAAQAIAELHDALRTVELMARNTAAGGTLAPSAGPRVVMPAGLGGLVATVERTTAPAGAQRAPRMLAQPTPAPLGQTLSAVASPATRLPAMTWLTPAASARPTTIAPTNALGAAMQSTPAALQHVAWSDRWLARFAGAQPQALDVFSAGAAATPELRASLLANAAPSFAFVAPVAEAPAPAAATPAPISAPESRAGQVVRYADDAETPDEVFAAIAAATMTTRAGAARTVAAPAQTAAVAAARATASAVAASQAYDPMSAASRETVADLVARAAPSAPGAGLSAGLASSPFAAALRHILPLGVAPSFDVRALFGSSLSATYLSGLIAASTDEVSITGALPTWATIADAPLTAIAGEPLTREVAEWQPTYVAPEVPPASTTTAEMSRDEEVAAQAAAMSAPMTTLRSALLSFDVERQAGSPVTAPVAHTVTPMLARTLVEPLSMPLFADTAAAREARGVELADSFAQSYGAPGQLADRAQSWSTAQERSTADLAFDFVTPELLLAARVYGLGPAEAAQAARLAIAGPGQLAAMASTVDRTFVQAMAIEAERRGTSRGRAITTAYPATQDTPGAVGEVFVASTSSTPTFPSGGFSPSTSAFGVERRTPRGAFLWPAATTAAMGLNALQPDSEQSMSVVALELLAAQAVAELGTYAALGTITETERAALANVASRAPAGATAAAPASGAEPTDEDVLASAAAFVPASRRDKFQALYVALSQSPSGRIASPAARAARALALAGRGEDTITARERASVAWDVLPVVFGERDPAETAPLSTGDALARNERRRDEKRAMGLLQVDARPGLSGLASRAGEALSSYAAPTAVAELGGSASGSSRRSDGAVMRAPTAAQELVQTGRPAGQFGGGEVEIPPWFEQAARKMLAERTNLSGDISLAELTLVTAAAPQQIAASSKSAGSSHAAAASSSAAGHGEGKAQQVDVDKLAEDVYREVLAMMDIARARNGEPYL